MTNTKSIQQKIYVSRCTGTPPTADSKRDLHVLHRTEKWNQIRLLEHKTNVAAAEITQRIEIGIRSRKARSAKYISPAVGTSKSPVNIKKVVFPEPLGPTMPT